MAEVEVLAMCFSSKSTSVLHCYASKKRNTKIKKILNTEKIRLLCLFEWCQMYLIYHKASPIDCKIFENTKISKFLYKHKWVRILHTQFIWISQYSTKLIRNNLLWDVFRYFV